MKPQQFFYYLAVIAVLFSACKKPNNEETNSKITYPATGQYGDNILSDKVTEVYLDTEYSMKADVPKNSNLTIILKDGSWLYGSPVNWSVTEYNDDTQSQKFAVLVGGKLCDLHLEFDGKDYPIIPDNTYITVEYYENDAKTPTKVKKLKLISSN